MSQFAPTSDQRHTASPPPHLEAWSLPPGWSWGAEAILREHRHYQEVVDALGRSLSLVSAPDPSHDEWLQHEARALAHRNHPSVPTTYHYWASYEESRRGPGYLRRWIGGETVFSRISRLGPDDVPFALQVLREAGSTLAYLHDTGAAHGAISASTVWLTPGGRLWLLGWEWVLPRDQRPAGLQPDAAHTPWPPEWAPGEWRPTPASDQWQLAAMLFTMLTGETPPERAVPPLSLLRPDCPLALGAVLERALATDPADRFPSVAAMLRDMDRHVSVRPVLIAPEGDELPAALDSAEARLRWATADDYEILSPLGKGMFGSVWRARDLSLAREVAIKVLHPHIARDDVAVARFRREARLAAQLAHAAIVPIYDTDSRGDIVWYTMELAEGGSVASLLSRSGPRSFEEIAPQVDEVLEALHAAHTSGIIHRDLKPENILIDRYRRWRIGDFGIAYALGEEGAGTSGTPSFAAPEQLLGEAQGPATDCYALASIVYFVVTGRAPFGDGRAETVLAQQLSNTLPARLLEEGLPGALADWLQRGLAVRVEDRFEDALEMRVAWREVVRAMRRVEDVRPWWRRLIEGGQEDGTSEPPSGW
ncbi:MAG: serine/threonine-protein kinase [Gemmatimonadota bacterium]|nr:serine/threonine-protein kinase [Gemmatimonadota bacterium]MDQ8166609.1 serine/threonine-protein kinase [Gemmatimonadota bacterium]MDQ8172856.1 serine/threonine-protein kinase [Gemmatimonadota bacterium]